MSEPKDLFSAFQSYWTDAAQRAVLSLDVLRQRGNDHFEHAASKAPNVLDFKVELIVDGRQLARPVNYGLTRVAAPENAPPDPRKPPIIVVDPRAGHGPGIGGMKDASEEPWYVLAKDLQRNVLIVGQGNEHPWLFSRSLVVRQVS